MTIEEEPIVRDLDYQIMNLEKKLIKEVEEEEEEEEEIEELIDLQVEDSIRMIVKLEIDITMEDLNLKMKEIDNQEEVLEAKEEEIEEAASQEEEIQKNKNDGFIQKISN